MNENTTADSPKVKATNLKRRSSKRAKSKNLFTSKTLWANLVMFLVAAYVPKAKEYVALYPEEALALTLAVNGFLRVLTKKALKLF
jgi:hypothetical protein